MMHTGMGAAGRPDQQAGGAQQPLGAIDPAAVVEEAPEGLAVIDGAARFALANRTAARLCGVERSKLIGSPSPFRNDAGAPADIPDTGERLAEWDAGPGGRREFAYRIRPLSDGGEAVVVFRDVTTDRRHQRRLAAIASVASRVAAQRSLGSALDELAGAVFEADALAAVQVLTVDSAGEGFQVMGTAGFDGRPDFFDLLLECREAGAELAIMEAFTTRRPVVVPHRYEVIMTDPAWLPLRECLRHPEWDWFASVPLMVSGKAVGVLNAFFAPGHEVGETTLNFLLAMAAQAARAADYAALVERERTVAIQQERQRLARDLHDSAVQQVFSMGMQVETLAALAGRSAGVEGAYVQQVAQDLARTTQVVLKDLRTMVTDLHPAQVPEGGLPAAVASLVEATRSRSGLDIGVAVDDPHHELDSLESELSEDTYRVIAEALHNSVKHSGGSRITVELETERRGARRRLSVQIADNGRGLPPRPEAEPAPGAGGFGMTTMKERACRWGGELTTRSAPGEGTAVDLVVPLPDFVPTGSHPGVLPPTGGPVPEEGP